MCGLACFLHAPRRSVADGAKPSIYVFLQLDAKASMVERTLQERLPKMTVTLFGRFRDFEEALTRARPDAILSITPVLVQRGATPVLQGKRGGSSSEPFVLASVNQPLAGSLAGKSIGIVDLFGREGTQTFLNDLLKTKDVKIKRVTKVEDLLALLDLSVADGIVLANSTLFQLSERTRLVLKSKDLPGAPVGLAALAVLNPTVRDVAIQSVKALDASTNRLLGVDSWSIP
ncbi:MAG: hypothetical protein ABUL77_00810 [Bacteroidota bacterium]